MIPLILLLPIASVALLPSAHASPATGTVCFSTNTTSCMTVFGATSPSGSSITVNVLLVNSDPLNGFDVQVLADHSVLQATGISLTGSILGSSASVVVECLDGSLVTGPSCTPQDGVGVQHLAAGITGSPIGTSGATSGLLFSITYTVVGSTTNTPVAFNTGCSGTSVASTCVTLTNGTGTPNSEMVQNATFANVSDFSIVISPNPIEILPGATGTATITLTAKGTFSSVVQLSIDASSTIPASITGLFANRCNLTAPTCSGGLSVGPAVAGTYSVKVDAVGLTNPISRSDTATVIVSNPDFTVAAAPSSLTVAPGGSGSSVITITAITGFSDSVGLTATAPSGVSVAFATNPVTGGSGTSAATISVSTSGVSGTITVTGTDQGTTGAGPHSATIALTVSVPDFAVLAVPGAISIPRGNAVVSTISVNSISLFAGSITLTAAITNQGTDSAGLTTNITPNFSPATLTLSAGGVVSANFFATTVKGSSFASPTDTATGNYTATITATSGSVSHQAIITFSVYDFSLGPTFCPGGTPILTTPNANFDPVFVGAQCNSLTITTETVANGGTDGLGAGLEGGTLWMQVGSLGGLASNGFNGNGVVALNPQLPGRGASSGVFVPELGFNVCILPTFWANGTQVPLNYLKAHGPIIAAGTGIYLPFGFNMGCRFDAGAYPNDIAAPHPRNNVDFFAIAAQSLSTTLPGTYTFNVCGLSGALFDCQKLTLNVIQPPFIHQFVLPSSVSFSGSGGVASGKVGITSPSTAGSSFPTYVQLTLSGVGSLGHTFSFTTAVFKTNPGGNINNIPISIPLQKSFIGETFTYSSTIFVGTAANALTGVSTVFTVSATLTVTA